MAMTDEQIERYSRHIILKRSGCKGTEEAPERKSTDHRCRRSWCTCGNVSGSSRCGNNRYCGCGRGRSFQSAETDHPQHSRYRKSKGKISKGNHECHESGCGSKNYRMFVDASNIRELIREYDFIIDGTDNFPAKFLINDACVMEKKPFSHAGIIRFKGQLMTYVPGGRSMLPLRIQESAAQGCSSYL